MSHSARLTSDPIFAWIEKERMRQESDLELIASENFTSPAVRQAMGSVLTHKYAEGYPDKRYYGGCEFVDEVEKLAIERAKKLFNACHANVQPHSGSQANAAVMLALLQPGDKILGFSLAHGGHLTHGSPVSFSGMLYEAMHYGVSRATGRIDWPGLEAMALREKPKLIICGASAYSRDWNYRRLRALADEIGAWLMADIAHPAGLIAKALLNHPFPYCHIVTTTTHKTLRGPRGGMILIGEDIENPLALPNPKGSRKKLSSLIDAGVFPGTQGGPLEHIIAAKAIAFGEALTDEYTTYIKQVQANARTLSAYFMAQGYDVISGGTDNHMFLLDLSNKGITGKAAENALGKAGIIVNKNMIPFDTQRPRITSGIRIGTPAITTRGMTMNDMQQVGQWINQALQQADQPSKLSAIKQEVSDHMRQLPLYAW